MRVTTLLLACACTLAVQACVQSPDTTTVGVDYYPEQWPLARMAADLHSIKQDLGADMIRIGEFMWSTLEPADGEFSFDLLDQLVDAAKAEGLCVLLGTPTATMPAWLYTQHPDVAMQGPDSPEGYRGAVAGFGGRRQYSFNSKKYQFFAERIVTQLAARYGHRIDVITTWQVDNELGHEGSDLDFSPNALQGWREWLAVKYRANITQLNSDWGTVFWGADYANFTEVPLPKYSIPGTAARPNEAWRSNMSPGMLLAYRQFRAFSIATFAEAQVAILRNYTTARITSNSPGGVWGKAMDSNLIFKKMDFPSYDNYPVWGGSIEPTAPSAVAMALDMVRGWGAFTNGKSGTGFMITEQLIGAQGHDIIGFTPRPQQVVAWSAQTLAHGATGLLFFRYRAALFGQEQFCYGILDHTTPRASGRKFEEAKQVFAIAKGPHASLWLAPIVSRVVLLYCPDNIFAWQAQPQSTAFDFSDEAHRLYKPFWRHGVSIDVVSISKLVSAEVDLSHYDVALLPAPMLVTDATVETLSKWVDAGGSLWVGFRADLKDERNQMRSAESRLAALAGVRVSEIESLNVGSNTSVRATVVGSDSTKQAEVRATVWREGLEITSNDTEALFEYTDDFFGALDLKAFTRRYPAGGAGEVVYLATGMDPAALEDAARSTLEHQQVPHLPPASDQLGQVMRQDTNGQLWDIRINYGTQAVTVHTKSNTISIAPYGVDILPHSQ